MGTQVQLSKYWGLSGRQCGACEAEPAAIHCRTCPGGAAFLCGTCDARAHPAPGASGHVRVWVCEVCELAPAAVTCKADAAVLCAACDADIHEANPLVRRHVRVPVGPIGAVTAAALDDGSVAGDAAHVSAPAEAALMFGVPDEGGNTGGEQQQLVAPVEMNPHNYPQRLNLNVDAKDFVGDKAMMKFDYFLPDLDPFLGMEYARLAQADRMVPGAAAGGGFEIDFGKVKTPYDPYTANSHSHSHSVTSSEAGVVPEAIIAGGGGRSNNPIEIDFTMGKPCYMSYTANSLSHSGSSSEAAVVAEENNPSAVLRSIKTDEGREARLMRYREKRKNRRFNKTIRYASRKAYAETRPRIKGRFAKLKDAADADADADDHQNQMAVPGFILDFGYGVVPSF